MTNWDDVKRMKALYRQEGNGVGYRTFLQNWADKFRPSVDSPRSMDYAAAAWHIVNGTARKL